MINDEPFLEQNNLKNFYMDANSLVLGFETIGLVADLKKWQQRRNSLILELSENHLEFFEE